MIGSQNNIDLLRCFANFFDPFKGFKQALVDDDFFKIRLGSLGCVNFSLLLLYFLEYFFREVTGEQNVPWWTLGERQEY